ncbi:MAG: hypothetical protein LRZ85_05310 [Alphaproteobacteria bacterium]|nr:hypothetical protein [Alphaproteobacteria bacterium]
MKLAFRDIEPFVKKPDPAARVVLVYGPDSGLMKERAALIGKSVVADLNDPFNVAVLNADDLAEDPARLSDEASAMSMMGATGWCALKMRLTSWPPLSRNISQALTRLR